MNTLKDYVNFRLTHADKIAEAEGYPLTMINCKKYKKMRDLKIYGNSVQDGTPTPDAPVEVQSVGDLTKNLFDINAIEENKYVDSKNGNTFDSTVSNTSDYIPVKATQYYCLHYDCETPLNLNTRGICFYDTNKAFLSGDLYAVTDKTKIISPKQDGYLRFAYDKSFTNIQLEEGTTVTPIEFFGKYKIPVVVRGKNLATAYEVCKNLAAYKETTLDGRECVMYQSNLNTAYTNYPFKENTQYTVSFYVRSVRWESLTGANCIFRFVYTDGSVGVAWENDAVYTYNDEGWKKITLTSRAGKSVKGLGTDANHYALRHHIDVNTFQLEEGTATEYEPYIEPVTTNIFLNEPLRKLNGTIEPYLDSYEDYIDFKYNKVARHIHKTTFDGTEVWRYESGEHRYYPSDNSVTRKWIRSYGLSNLYPNDFDATDMRFFISGANIQLNIKDSNYSNATDFKNMLQNNNLIVYYAEETPIDEPLNLDLPKLNAKTTIIEVDTNLVPSNAYGKYIKR